MTLVDAFHDNGLYAMHNCLTHTHLDKIQRVTGSIRHGGDVICEKIPNLRFRVQKKKLETLGGDDRSVFTLEMEFGIERGSTDGRGIRKR